MVELIVTCDKCGKKLSLSPDPWMGVVDIDLNDEYDWWGQESQVYCSEECWHSVHRKNEQISEM